MRRKQYPADGENYGQRRQGGLEDYLDGMAPVRARNPSEFTVDVAMMRKNITLPWNMEGSFLDHYKRRCFSGSSRTLA